MTLNEHDLYEEERMEKRNERTLEDLPISEEDYKILGKIVLDIRKDFNKKVQKLANKLMKLNVGQFNILMEALNIAVKKFEKEAKK